jgi:2'-5' RNA ligase
VFCALTLPDDTREWIALWQRASLECPNECSARIVDHTHLHITLAFLGHRPRSRVPAITEALGAAARAAESIVLSLLRYRETRSVAMLVLDDVSGQAGRLAGDLHERLEQLGVYEREGRAWLPHVTVLRFRARPGLRPPLPAIPAFSPSEAAVYHSRLAPDGARYEVLESVPLGSSDMVN